MSKISSIQVLRGVAATLVAGFHLQQAALVEGGDPGFFSIFAGGEIGVDIFFVISGFIIYFVSKNRPAFSRSEFLVARFWRIFPPYWTILTLYILAAAALALVFGDHSKLPDMQKVVISYLLLPYPSHIITIAWTLSIEIIFYLVFAFSFFVKGGDKYLFLTMVIWVIASQVFSHFVVSKPEWLLIALNTAAIEFLFGIFIAILFLNTPNGRLKLRLPALLLGVFGVVAYLLGKEIPVEPFGRELAAGIPAALLVYGALGFSLEKVSVLETWGESSYVLYLLHVLYFSIFGKVIEAGLGVNVYHSQMWMLFLLVSVLVISYLSTLFLERPYQIWYRQFLTRSLQKSIRTEG